jgi:hypothetical protein
MKRLLPISALLVAILVLVASCGTSKNGTRKCDGRKGQKTPMGLI